MRLALLLLALLVAVPAHAERAPTSCNRAGSYGGDRLWLRQWPAKASWTLRRFAHGRRR
jgi:hypothetical protein